MTREQYTRLRKCRQRPWGLSDELARRIYYGKPAGAPPLLGA